MFSPTRSAARPVHLTSHLWAGRGRVGIPSFVELRRRHGAYFLHRSNLQFNLACDAGAADADGAGDTGAISRMRARTTDPTTSRGAA